MKVQMFLFCFVQGYLQAFHKGLWSIDYYSVVSNVYITLQVQLVSNFV